MKDLQDAYNYIDSQQENMTAAVIDLASINSHTFNLAGLKLLTKHVIKLAEPLIPNSLTRTRTPATTLIDDTGNITTHQLADTLILTRRPIAPIQVLLSIHLDTVYPIDHPFQTTTLINDHTLRGPGVLDAKGGLVTLIYALRALERSPHAKNIGWKIILNTDEEIGSPGSASILKQHATTADFGLVFEPCLPNGDLISHRKGSGNFTLAIRGTAAHAGRDFFQGKNALLAAADIAHELAKITDQAAGTTLNIAALHAGGPFNVIPDLAILKFNLRTTDTNQQTRAETLINNIIKNANTHLPTPIIKHGSFHSPPKPLTPATTQLIEDLQFSASQFGLSFDTQSSGGVCDGNKLAAAGLPNIDTLGPQGNHMHSENEYLITTSLAERCKLTASLLINYASGSRKPPQHTTP